MRTFAKVLSVGMGLLVMVGCQSQDKFLQSQLTEYFTQNFNPPQIDVLWVVDNRSPMFAIKNSLAQEAGAFFQRLDASSSSDYRMGIVTADMQFSNGDLFPKENPVVLTKGLGTLAQRTAYFSNVLVDAINLRTGATDQSFASALTALKTRFIPRQYVPLVLVFISDSDDHSAAVGEAVSYYQAEFLALKENQSDQLRVYSINLVNPYSPANRCTTIGNADIDKPGFEDRFFRLANALSGDTSNLCQPFASSIDLTGLKLTEPTKRFVLSGRPDSATSLVVNVMVNGTPVPGLKWTYDAASNSILFDTAPPEGATIQVTFLPKK